MDMAVKETLGATELSRRRRAIYRGLSRFIQGDRLMELLCLWEERYINHPPFELLTFLDDVCTTPQCRQHRKDIHLALVQSMLLPLDKLGPDPWPEMRQYLKNRSVPATAIQQDGAAAVKPGKTASESSATANRVFWSVLQNMLKALAAIDPDRESRVRSELASAMLGDSPSRTSARLITGWLVSDHSEPGKSLNPAILPWALHQSYVIACEHYGPKTVDQALNDGVRAAEQLPEAKEYSPKKLL